MLEKLGKTLVLLVLHLVTPLFFQASDIHLAVTNKQDLTRPVTALTWHNLFATLYCFKNILLNPFSFLQIAD